MTKEVLQNCQKRSGERQKVYKQFLQKADKNQVLKALPQLHDEAFEKIDCLQCANCCRNYSPRFKTADIKRIAKLLNMKEGWKSITRYYMLERTEAVRMSSLLICGLSNNQRVLRPRMSQKGSWTMASMRRR